MAMDFDPKIKELGDRIANLTLIEAKAVSDYLREVHGIESASAPPRFTDGYFIDPMPKENARTEFNVVLDGYDPSRKIMVIKIIRSVTGSGLKEAKDMSEALPATIKENISKDEAERIIREFQEAGGKARLV